MRGSSRADGSGCKIGGEGVGEEVREDSGEERGRK